MIVEGRLKEDFGGGEVLLLFHPTFICSLYLLRMLGFGIFILGYMVSLFCNFRFLLLVLLLHFLFSVVFDGKEVWSQFSSAYCLLCSKHKCITRFSLTRFSLSIPPV